MNSEQTSWHLLALNKYYDYVKIKTHKITGQTDNRPIGDCQLKCPRQIHPYISIIHNIHYLRQFYHVIFGLCLNVVSDNRPLYYNLLIMYMYCQDYNMLELQQLDLPVLEQGLKFS